MREFNKERFFSNVSYMLEQLGMKIGEFEAAAGVHAGYISRTVKDEKSKPGIDFVVKAAQVLQTSMDGLLTVDLSELTATEKYLQNFLEKAKQDTIDGKLDWNRETAHSLGQLKVGNNGSVDHPLFKHLTVREENECDDVEEVTGIVMVSHAFEEHTRINGDCFNLRLKNGVIFYLMNICKSVCSVADQEAYGKEVWMFQPDELPQFLCSSFKGDPLSASVELLYTTLVESFKHPHLKKGIQSAIDAFMNDDLEDDAPDFQSMFDDEEIPF